MQKLVLIAVLALTVPALAQQTSPSTPLTLQEVLVLAKANEPAFAAASATARVAALDRSIAHAALLPSATYHNQVLYTQPNGSRNGGGPIGSQSSPKFIANNAVHEYASQGVINETIGLQQITAATRAAAAEAVALAELEIARRGLVDTVTNLYYQVIASDRKTGIAQRALNEAASFTSLTQQREAAREAAHADVVKAQLQQQQRERDLSDGLLQQQKSHLELGVLLFADPRTGYSLVPGAVAPLPARAEVDNAAMRLNPELHSALAALRVSDLDVTAARAAYLPDLALNFTYGIDAVQFAVNGDNGVRNLGYSAGATLDFPVWDWLSTQHRVRQSKILREAAHTVVSATQRRLIAQLDEFYAEAEVARAQMQSLDASVGTAGESLRLTRLRYAAGEATVLEVVDAQNALTAAENARQDGDVRYQLAIANLQLLTGAL